MTSTPPAQGTSARTVERAVAAALETVRRNIPAFGDSYPDDTTTDGRYLLRPAAGGIPEGGNRGWTTSFWPGTQWLAWRAHRRRRVPGCRGPPRGRLRAPRARGRGPRHARPGLPLQLSSVAAWRLLGDEDARDAGLLAADHLMRRFLEPAGIIQAWGDLSDPAQSGRTIIDSLMNMPLLTWAGEETGDARFADAVRRHTSQLREHILRADDSTFHTFYWDVETGEPLRGATEQGAHDDSCWARGQAWGIYGFALNHRATGDQRLLDAAWRCADYFLAHLPADLVPYWDLVYTDGSDAPRDSSAAAIAVCGYFELAAIETDPGRAERALTAAHDILGALIEHCTPDQPEDSDALLLHGVYDLPKNIGVDEGTLWGDYYYLEALTRAAIPGWRPSW